MGRTAHIAEHAADAHEVTSDEPIAAAKPVLQRTWVGVLLVAVGFAVGSWLLALVMVLAWAGSRIVAINGAWRSPVWRIVVRTLIVVLIAFIIGLTLSRWNPVGAERQDADPSTAFAGLTIARFETATGVAGECGSVPSIATLDHTHDSAFEAMREVSVDLTNLAATDLRIRVETGNQLVRFGQGDGVLERLAIVAEETDDKGQTLIFVLTAELFPATTDGTAGARRAQLATDVTLGDESRTRPDRVEAVVTMHAWGPCPPGLGFDFWVNATRDPLSSPWELTSVPLSIAPSPHRD